MVSRALAWRAGVGLYYSNDIHGVPAVLMQTVRHFQRLTICSPCLHKLALWRKRESSRCMLVCVVGSWASGRLHRAAGHMLVLCCRALCAFSWKHKPAVLERSRVVL